MNQKSYSSNNTLPELFREFENVIKHHSSGAEQYAKQLTGALFIEFVTTGKFRDDIKLRSETYKEERKKFIESTKEYVSNAIEDVVNDTPRGRQLLSSLDSITNHSNFAGFRLERMISNFNGGLITNLYNALEKKGLYGIGVAVTKDMPGDRSLPRFKQYNILADYLEQ